MKKILMALVLAFVLIVPFSQGITFRTGVSDGATYIPGVTETYIPSTITVVRADGTGAPVTQEANVPPNYAINFNILFDKTYDVTYSSPGYQTDIDDYYFDSKLQNCVTGNNCNMVTEQFSTACNWNATFNDWTCKLTDTDNNQWITFIYNKNDPVYGEIIRSFNLLFPDIPGNMDPVLNPIGNRIVNEGQSMMFVVTATDPNNDPIVFDTGNINPLPRGSTFSGNTFSWTPDFTQAGTYSVTVWARDPFGAYDSETVTITVVDVTTTNPPAGGNPPRFTSNPVTNASPNVPYMYDADAFDPDGDSLSYSLEQKPTGMVINPQSGVITWTPTTSQDGKHSVIVAVTDGRFIVRQRYTINAGNVFSSIARKVLKLTRISAVGECYAPGSEVPVFTSADNKADGKLKNVRYTASIPQLGLRKQVGPFNINENRGTTRQVYMELEEDTPEGEYSVRVVMSNDDIRRVRVRPIVVSENCE